MTNDLLQRDGTKIEWADFTFNPWIGCAKVSDGCKFCYAETLMDTRYKKAKWGVNGTRVKTSAKNWKDPIKWNKEAEKLGVRYRVFCASLADVFEDREELVLWLMEVLDVARLTPNLDWLFLTKRTDKIIERLWMALAMARELKRHELAEWLLKWVNGTAPDNVWMGASVESNDHLHRIDDLLKVPAKVHFISAEPLLSDLDLRKYLGLSADGKYEIIGSFTYDFDKGTEHYKKFKGIDWVICGGESGTRARPMHPDWARSLRDQCQKAGVSFFFKQWGEWMLTDLKQAWKTNEIVLVANGDQKIVTVDNTAVVMRKVGKKKAGALLDGREWKEVPFYESDPESFLSGLSGEESELANSRINKFSN